MDAFVGMETSVNGTSGAGVATYGLYFDAISAFTLKTVNVYPNAASNNLPGTVTISVINPAGTVLHQATVDVVGFIQSTNPSMQTVDLNFEIVPATNLRLVMTAKTGVSGLMFQPSAQGPYPFPYTLDGIVSITSGTYTGTVFPSLYYYFYNWQVTKGCASARTAVAAIVTPPPAINATATPSGVCESSSTVIKVTSSNAPYTYNWMPGSLNGSTHTVYPLANTTYIVTASDAVSGCVNMDTVAVTVLATPTPITVTPAAPIINPGDIQTLTATGGTLNSNGVFGTGTTTNTTTGYPAPYTNYYGGTKHQMLIKASELTAQGLFPGASITSLTFTVTAVGTTFTGVLNNFQIDVGHTTQTVLTSTAFLAGLTNVLPASNAAIAVGTITHTFAVPYTWDGTRNIVIQTSYNNGNNGTTTDFVQMSNTVQSFVGCNYYRADNQTAAQILGALTPTGSTTSRPNITLGYNSPVLVTWVPYTNLYRNATATLPYTGQSLTTVYAKPSQTTTYTVLSLAPLTNCLRSKTVTVTVTSPCQSPTNAGASSITASTANISWTAPASPPGSGYQYEVRISGAPGSGPTGLAVTGTTGAGVTNASLSGLTSSTLYHVYVRANCGDDVYSDWTTDSQFTTLAGVPENRTVGNITVNTGQNNCYDATNTITVAGSGTTFMVQSGGSATFIAGMKILYLPGTSVLSGGYMLGKIAPSGPFCSPAKLTEVAAGAEEVPVSSERAYFTLYPNPTNGNFTLVQKGNLTYGDVKVEIYSISGKIVLTESLVGQQKHEFRFSEMPSGLYFVKVVADDYVETIKLVKTR
jgi:hypothetical protein